MSAEARESRAHGAEGHVCRDPYCGVPFRPGGPGESSAPLTRGMERRDVLETLALLCGVEEYLRAVKIAMPSQDAAKRYEAVRAEHKRLTSLYDRCDPGPMEAFTADHPMQYDALDSLYDCGNETCPSCGFKDAADRDHHHRMWGLT